MDKFPKLNFPSVRFRAIRKNGIISVWDDIRKTYLTLTPEEWVRQHLIAMLIDEKRIYPTNIIQEYPVNLNGQAQRADIVIVDKEQMPLMLIECKAPTIAIDNEVLAQTIRYNYIVKARYIMLTNGLRHYYYRNDDMVNYSQLADMPI